MTAQTHTHACTSGAALHTHAQKASSDPAAILEFANEQDSFLQTHTHLYNFFE